MEITTIFRLLIRRIWILITVPIIAAAGAFFFTLKIEKKYKSTAQLATGFTTNDQINLTNERFSLYDAGMKFNNMLETMKSELILSQVAYRLLIHDLTDDRPFRELSSNNLNSLEKLDVPRSEVLKKAQQKLESIEVLSPYLPEDEALIEYLRIYGYASWMLKNDINIDRINNTDYVSVKYISENPLLSAFVVNAESEEYIRYVNRNRTNISNESVSFFAELVEEKKKTLDEKTTFINNFKASNNLFVEDQTDFKRRQISQFEMLRQDKMDKIQGLRLSLANVNSKMEKMDPNLPNSRAAINQKILEIRSKINELNQIYVNGGSKDRELLATINTFREQLQIEMNVLANTPISTAMGSQSKDELLLAKEQLELELQIEERSLSSISLSIVTLKNSVSGALSKEATIEALEREIKTASEEYLQALDKYNTEKNKSRISETSIELIIRGQPNGSPESSKKVLIIALAGIGSFGLCVLAILMVEFFDMTIKNPSRFKSLARVNLMGQINHIPLEGVNLSLLFKSKTKKTEFESYKHFLSKIRFEIEHSGCKCILFTSTKPKEGKTFTILSLSYSLSLLNRKILLIDTNFRNNSLTRSLIAKPNFDKMLMQDNDIKLLVDGSDSRPASSPKNIVSSTNDKNIDIIGSNVGMQTPAEILAGRNFESMITSFKDSYDYIFLEGASLNEYSDSKELLTFVDGVVSVFSARASIKQNDLDSISYLKKLNGKLIGAVLNNVKVEDSNS